MKLIYYPGNNFGDALNPIIFNHYLPNFFDNDDSTAFLGIGSILGLVEDYTRAKNKIVFSSGFAYGTVPEVDESYNIVCVRGPLTAKKLGLPDKLAVADGAILIRNIIKVNKIKEFDFSFMPHWESELKFDWKKVCSETGVNYISPTKDPMYVIDQISKSKFVIAEAMHAAIISDSLRVPWAPVRIYGGINSFKWNDWCASMNLKYSPTSIPSLFSNTEFVKNLIHERYNSRILDKTFALSFPFFNQLQKATKWKSVISKIESLKMEKNYLLSSENLLDEKLEILESKLEQIKKL